MEVGKLTIAGTLDSSEIESGATRINQSMSDVKLQTESTFGSMERLSGVASALAKSFISIGSIGVGAMTALASTSPMVAPAMAKISNEMRNLSFALGEKLRPLFESIGNDLIPAIGTAIEKFTPQIESMVSVGTEGIGDISSVLKGEWGEISNIIPKTAGVAIGIRLGAPFGLQGMLIGAALGYAAGDIGGGMMKETWEGGLGSDVKQLVDPMVSLSGMPQVFDIIKEGGKIHGIEDNFLVSLFNNIGGLFNNVYNSLFENLTDKQLTFTNTEKV